MGVEELLDATDDEDFTEELEDFTELLLCLLLDDEFTDELDLAELLLDPSTPALPPLRMTLDEEHGMTLEEEPFLALEEEPSLTFEEELLDSRLEPGVTEEGESSLMLEEDSSRSSIGVEDDM